MNPPSILGQNPVACREPAAGLRFSPTATGILWVSGGEGVTASMEAAEQARMLGQTIADAHMSLIFDGKAKGLAAAVAQGAVDAGAEATAMICPPFPAPVGCAVVGCRTIVARDAETARRMLFKLADGVVMLPGRSEDLLVQQWAGTQPKRMVIADFEGFPSASYNGDSCANPHPVARSPHQVLPLLFDVAVPTAADSGGSGAVCNSRAWVWL